MNSADFVSVKHVLSSVTKTVDDEDYRNGFSEGWYVSCAQDGMQEAAIDTFYDKQTIDIDFPSSTFALDIPKNCFNLRELYLFTGDCCQVSSSARVYWKRLGNNKGNGPGYTAAIKRAGETSMSDPFNPSIYNNSFGTPGRYGGRLLWANIVNGQIQFGPDCAGYGKVRVVFNGMGGMIGDEPVIPRMFESYLNSFIEERYFRAMKSRDPRTYRPLWMDAKTDLRENQYKVEKRIKMMNSWERESLMEYLSNPLHK